MRNKHFRLLELTGFELNIVLDFSSGDINLDTVVDAYHGIRITDCTGIVSDNERDAFRANL